MCVDIDKSRAHHKGSSVYMAMTSKTSIGHAAPRKGSPSAATSGPEAVTCPLVSQDLIANAQKSLSMSTTCAPANPGVVSTSVLAMRS